MKVHHGKGARGGHAPMAEINIIPLVDVVLVLLVIFMATTAFVTDQKKQDEIRQLPLQLPESSASVTAPTETEILILGITSDGQKYVQGEKVSTEEMHRRVREVALKNPQTRVRLDADRDTRFQDIVEVIELCEFEGLRHVGLHTAKQSGQ
jgi:biopolymer transport protein ExbD